MQGDAAWRVQVRSDSLPRGSDFPNSRFGASFRLQFEGFGGKSAYAVALDSMECLSRKRLDA